MGHDRRGTGRGLPEGNILLPHSCRRCHSHGRRHHLRPLSLALLIYRLRCRLTFPPSPLLCQSSARHPPSIEVGGTAPLYRQGNWDAVPRVWKGSQEILLEPSPCFQGGPVVLSKFRQRQVSRLSDLCPFLWLRRLGGEGGLERVPAKGKK